MAKKPEDPFDAAFKQAKIKFKMKDADAIKYATAKMRAYEPAKGKGKEKNPSGEVNDWHSVLSDDEPVAVAEERDEEEDEEDYDEG